MVNIEKLQALQQSQKKTVIELYTLYEQLEEIKNDIKNKEELIEKQNEDLEELEHELENDFDCTYEKHRYIAKYDNTKSKNKKMLAFFEYLDVQDINLDEKNYKEFYSIDNI